MLIFIRGRGLTVKNEFALATSILLPHRQALDFYQGQMFFLRISLGQEHQLSIVSAKNQVFGRHLYAKNLWGR